MINSVYYLIIPSHMGLTFFNLNIWICGKINESGTFSLKALNQTGNGGEKQNRRGIQIFRKKRI